MHTAILNEKIMKLYKFLILSLTEIVSNRKWPCTISKSCIVSSAIVFVDTISY